MVVLEKYMTIMDLIYHKLSSMGLDYYVQKIQENKKKQTIQDVVTQIASRYPLVLHKQDGAICMFPQNTRVIPSVSIQTFD